MSGLTHRARTVAGPALRPRRREAGSAIVFVMLTVCVLSVVAASLLLTNVSRYQTTFQSASWQEAIVGSEAGVDLAMNELRKRVITGPGNSFPTQQTASTQTLWTTTNPQTVAAYANYGHAFPANNQPYQIATHGGEGNTAMQLRVFVDVPGASTTTDFAQANDTSFISQVDNPALRDPDGVDRSRWLFRIRSLGIAGLSGPPRPNLNKLDNLLRRFSFFNDWRTGRPVTSPQVARMVEAVVRPETGFRNALMANGQINLSNQDVLVDSYDSSKGVYNATTNHGQMGNIATNGQLINANHATVDGNAMTNNGSVANAQNVTGQESSTFYQELTPLTTAMLNPAWSGVADGGTVTSTSATPYIASASSTNPTLVRFDGINLSNGNTISINAPANSSSTAPSYIKVYVQGDVTTSGAGQIVLAPNVNAIFYVTGNVNLQGIGIINNTQLARNLVINGVQPTANADGSYPTRTISIATTQDFEGIVYAPNHDLSLALQAVPIGGTGSSGSSGEPVVTYTGSDPGIIALEPTINQQVYTGYNLTVDEQAQRALLQQNSNNSAAQQKLSQDQTQYNQLQTSYNQNVARVQQLGGTVNVTAGTLSSSSASDHTLGYNGIYGGFVAQTITVAEKTHIHYDETLRNAGPVNHYEIVNWFEDHASHDATGGPEQFWW